MTLSMRPSADTQPTWDIARDLLSFLRCGLQYRYSRPGKPRPSHSSQQFSGQFLQQVQEDAWLLANTPSAPPFPWPEQAVQELLNHVEQRLAAQGVRCHSASGRHYTRLRAAAAINELGPLLFPLLCHARLRVSGSFHNPNTVPQSEFNDIPACELTATIHAVARLQLHDPALGRNPLVKLLQQQLPQAPSGTVELLIDFQGNRRPYSCCTQALCNDSTQLQIQATSFLYGTRTQHPVIAGLVCYLSELVPSRRDFLALRKALIQRPGDPDIPAADSLDAAILRTWKARTPGEVPPLLSLPFRLQRTIRVINVSVADQQVALKQLRNTVQRILQCRSQELLTGHIISAWERNASQVTVCQACDARTWCPDHTSKLQPDLPGIRRC